MQAATYEATNQTNFKPRDKELLAKIRYTNTPVAEPFRRAIVEYHRKEAPGSIVVDSDNHYLYYVLNDGKAIRYGITVGEEAMAWSGIAKVGSMTEWPPWHPTKSEIERLGVPTFVAPGPDNPMGSRAIYLYSGGKDTLFRIHGTNQPEYIGASISSGCIRLTNEDVIDLYNRVKMGTIVVVLEPHHGDSPFNSQMALQGGGAMDAVADRIGCASADKIKSAGFTGAFSLAVEARRCPAPAASGLAAVRFVLRRIWRRLRAAAPRPGARPATAARPAAADPTHSTGRSCSCCAAPSDRDGCGPHDTSPSPAPARLKTARTPNAARSRATRATPCGRSARSTGRWRA